MLGPCHPLGHPGDAPGARAGEGKIPTRLFETGSFRIPPKLREHQAAARAQPTAGKSLISVLGVPATRQSAPHTRSSNTARQGERRQSCRSSWKEFCRRRAGGGELRYLRDVTELWPEALCTSPTGEVPSRAAAAAPPPRTHRRHRRTAANWCPELHRGQAA